MHFERPSDWPMRMAGTDVPRDRGGAAPSSRADIALAGYLDGRRTQREAASTPVASSWTMLVPHLQAAMRGFVRLAAPAGGGGGTSAGSRLLPPT